MHEKNHWQTCIREFLMLWVSFSISEKGDLNANSAALEEIAQTAEQNFIMNYGSSVGIQSTE